MDNTTTREIINYLGSHIRDIHARKMSVANIFAQDYSAYIHMLSFINTYIKRIESYIDGANIKQGAPIMPFVLLGSFVHVACDDGKICCFRVVLPQKKPLPDKQGVITVSCLECIGSLLLFRRVGEQVSVNEQEKQKMGMVQTIDFETQI